MTEAIKKLNNKELRKFGIIFTAMLVAIFGFLIPSHIEGNLSLWPFYTGAFILLLSFFRPQWLFLIYTPWMRIGMILGWINTRIILSIIFFLIVTPLGIILRLRGHDLMQRRFDKTLTSYRKISPLQPIQHMERPF